MGAIKNFEDFEVWKLARQLNVKIYSEFKESKEYHFRDQIFRCTLSVMNNIAEGFERNTPKEFIRFLKIAKGSCGEVKSMLYLAGDIKLIEPQKASKVLEETDKLLNKIGSLISYLKKQQNNPTTR